MKTQMIHGLVLVLAAPLTAQGWLYSPKDLDTKTEGNAYSTLFGGYSNARLQFGDGENRTAAVITAFNLRLDYRNYSTYYGPGRNWANVKMSIGEGDVGKFTATFASNFTTTPSTVFNATWSLPTVPGIPSTVPAAYGGPNGEFRIPFATNFVYSGKGDIVHDWQFTGGTLVNSARWSTSVRSYYYFDSFSNANEYSISGGSAVPIPISRLDNNSAGVTGRCNDSAHSTNRGARCYAYANLYGEKYPIQNYRGRLYFYHYSYYTGFENPVIHALALASNTSGVDLGTGCYKLYVKGPLVLVPRVTMPESLNASGYSGYRFRLLKWRSAFANLQVTAQAAWADSSTKAFNLSQAYQLILPPGLPRSSAAPRRIATYQYSSPTATTGYGPYDTYSFNPATAWETK